ncbi:hypothetical protein [Kaarinaea lacus]
MLVTLLTVVSGCASSDSNRTVYDALIQRECIQKTGEPNCDSGQPSYDEYRREREAINAQE